MDISPALRKILMMSFNDARISHHEYITAEHVLKNALLFDTVRNLLSGLGADIGSINEILVKYLTQKVPVIGEGTEPLQQSQSSTAFINPSETVGFQNVINRAVCHCAESEKGVLDIDDVLVSMLDEKNSYCSYSLRAGGVTRLRLLEAIGAQSPIASTVASNDASNGKAGKTKSALEKYCTELLSLARNGNIDKVIGREEETERMIQVLCRRTKNNPILVGEAGVGKTAVASSLALRIASGQVPDALKDCAIYSLDVGLLVAGTRYRGDFEERVRRITEEMSQKGGKAILFIDEIHTIMGAGSASGGALDAAALLKPALAQGKLHCIGSTTYDEYSQVFEKDAALSRRFQKIDIKEPTAAQTLLILKGLKDKYEQFHGVKYSAPSLQEAVNLSVRYLPARRLPDKAIDILDEAGSFVKTQGFSKEHIKCGRGARGGFDVAPRSRSSSTLRHSTTIRTVTSQTMRLVASRMAGVEALVANTNEKDKLLTLEDSLMAAVFGQDDAIRTVSKAIKRARAGIRDEERPEAAFLFVGPTGVGKTELSKTLSSVLCVPLLRFDMSEYQEEYAVSRLIGSAPGYIGYDEGGRLTEEVRRNPRAVILFDEIEKAHEKIQNVLLQVMDYGFLTDSRGRKADFRNCIIIMTSNAGARDMDKGAIGFLEADTASDDATLHEAVDKAFSPEFRGRLDAVVVFHHLDEATARLVAKKEMGILSSRLAKKHITLNYTDAAISLLTQKGWSRDSGARDMARTVQDLVADPLTYEVLFGRLSGGGKVQADAHAGNITFDF